MQSDLTEIGAWADLGFFKTGWAKIAEKLEREEREILPPTHLRFAALSRTPPDQTRVVVLGQDPYPTPGHADGLAFSVSSETPLPRSLANIYTEMRADIGGCPRNGNLGFWADQGVLLLNTALSTPVGTAGGHARLGWDQLAREVFERLNDRPRAFILWGNYARGYRRYLSNEAHLILESAHPSPLSARRGFFGSRPFSQVNVWLAAEGYREIDWVGRVQD